MSIKSSKLREKNNGGRERERANVGREEGGEEDLWKCPKSDLSIVNKEIKGWD